MAATSTSSLSTVVSSLMRASMGAAVAPTVKDEDLDRHVAELIMKEAKQAEERYNGKDGIRAYLPNAGLADTSLPKANKRFLHTIIRNVDDHNTAISQSQAKAAEYSRLQREEAERADRRARAVEASQDRLRRLMGTSNSRRSHDRRESAEWSHPSSSSHRTQGENSRTVDSDHEYHSSRWPAKRRRDEIDYVDDEGYYYDYPTRSNRARESEHDRNHPSRRHNSNLPRSRSRSRSRSPSRSYTVSSSSEASSSRHRDDGSPRVRDETSYPEVTIHKRSSAVCAPSLEKDGDLHATLTPSSIFLPSEKEKSGSRRKRRRSGSYTPEDRHRHRQRDSERDQRLRRTEIRPDSRSRSRSPRRSSRKDKTREAHSQSKHSRSHHESTNPKKHSGHGRVEERKSKGKWRVSASRHDGSDDDEVGPRPSTHSSKMDKYFDPAYDPSLDYTPSLDLNSVVADGAFDGWNTMLQIVRMRREDKEDRERAKKLGLSDSSRTKLGRDTEPGVMDIVYTKRGATREWDLGKE